MRKLLAVLQYILSVHVFALFTLALIRIIFYSANQGIAGEVEGKTWLFFMAMLKGLRFDNTMSCYVIALPLFVLLVFSIFNKIPRIGIRICNVYFIILYSILAGLSVADIPYFAYNQVHLGGSILHWLSFGGQTAAMILEEKSYYFYIILFIVFIVMIAFVISFLSRKLLNKKFDAKIKCNYKLAIPSTLVVFVLCFFGIRGTFASLPLRASDAYFCTSPFFNQLGINPTFFFIKSTSNYLKKYNSLDGLMDPKEAIHYVQKQFGIAETDSLSIARFVQIEGEPRNMNVVIVLMESFSSDFLDYTYKDQSLTPYIHSLIDKSYYFNNFYSAGNHTNNGIGATHYGYPPLFSKSMMTVDVDLYDGLPNALQRDGYENLFFITGDASYDYMNSFLYDNGFEKIFAQPDYPSNKVVSNFGVQDDYLFEFGIPELTKVSNTGQPFLATFLTVSNHPPFILPDGFKDKGEDDAQRMIAYVDNSIKILMEQASKEPWFDNTIFVFLGDHGRAWNTQTYEMPLPYNHVPLIIYSPAFEDAPKRCEQFGGQIDVFPTLMGLLNRPYTNNTLGVDLFKETRPCMFFVSDTHLGCINNDFFYFYNISEKNEGLFDYRNNGVDNLIEKYPTVKDSLKTYATSMMVTADYMVKNKAIRSSK